MSISCRYILDDGTQCSEPVVDDQRFCSEHTARLEKNLDENDFEVYKVVVEKVNKEVGLFWTRANFYLVVQAGLLSIAVSLLRGTSLANKWLIVVMCLVGFSLAVVWFLVMRATIHWIEVWREKVITLDKAVDRFEVLSTVEGNPGTTALMRPAYLTRYLPWIFMVAWILLLAIAVLVAPWGEQHPQKG